MGVEDGLPLYYPVHNLGTNCGSYCCSEIVQGIWLCTEKERVGYSQMSCGEYATKRTALASGYLVTLTTS